MSSRGSIADRWAWTQLNANAKPEEVIRVLNERCGALERTLSRIQERVEYGPVPGAYLPVFLTFPGAVTTVTSACVVSLQTTRPMSLRPIWATAAIAGGTSVNWTVSYWFGGFLGLVSGTAVPEGVHVDDRLNFDTDMIVNNASNIQRLRLSTTGAVGSPRDLTVMVVFKDVSKVEPA